MVTKISKNNLSYLRGGETKSMMNKMFKKVSAVALAAAMTLGSSVAAQAATVKSILEEWTSE